MDKIYFIGALPPPNGGVTIYNLRKIEFLRKSSLVEVVQPKMKNLIKIFFIMLFSTKVTYISSMNFILVFFNCFSIFKNKVFIDHNASRDFVKYGFIKKVIYTFSLSSAKSIVLVNGHLKNNYKNLYESDFVFFVESAFLPSDIKNKESILNTYPVALKIDDGNQCVVASISKPSLKDGSDVYNSELILNVFDSLSKKFPSIYFIVAISDVSGKDDYSKYIVERANEIEKIRSNFFLLSDGKILWPIFERAILYFRPTLTDGDSITIHEANYFGSKVLCSDVVVRPSFCQLFNLSTDNVEELMISILEKK